MTNEELTQAAQSGDRVALEELVTQIQKPIYNLVVRMFWLPEDAEAECHASQRGMEEELATLKKILES